MGHRSALALLLLLTGLVSIADAADGDDRAPILRIETGMHDAVINRLALADDGRELLTVSDDKTTRRWSLADGGARTMWRTPIGDGDQGALYAVAAAGDTVVVGGRTGSNATALYVLDRRSGQMRGSIGGFAEAISALAFSPDGHYLAVGLQGRGGLTLVDFTQRKLAGEDRDYGGTVEWIAFAADGRLATSSADGKLRLYDAHLKLAAASAFADAAAGERPWGLAFSPDGAQLAVGSLGAAKIRLFAGGLKLERTLGGAPSRSGALSVVAWSADGATLAAAGSYKDGARRLIRFWHGQGKDIAAGSEVAVARDTVTDLALLAGGRAVYVTAEPAFGVVAEDGKASVHRDAGKGDFRDAWRDAFRVSPDGAVVDFSTEPGGKRRFRFDLVEGALSRDPAPRSDLKRAALEDGRLKIADWQNGTAPKLNGRVIALDPSERVQSIAILSGGDGVALGTDFYVRLEHAAGEGWRKLVPAPAWSVNASGDGRYVLAALGDGSIRWYATADGREIMTLFVDPRDGRWVAWTPEGFFDHSHAAGGHGGETLVGYHLNNGPSKGADFVEIGQLYNLFYRRDLVLAKFRGGAAGERGVAQQLARIGDVRAVLKTGLPPRVELIEGCIRAVGAENCPAGAAIVPADPADRRASIAGRGGELFARYRVVDLGGGLGRVILRRNGAVIDGVRKVEGSDAQHRLESVALALDPAGDEVRLASESQSAAIHSRDDDDLVIDAKPSAAPVAPDPTTAKASVQLFVLAIGVSQYRQPEFRLANAANDARAVTELLRKPTPPVYDAADVATLLDDAATAPNIIQALQQIAAKARPQDLVVIFLSGHGESVDGKYFFAPVDFATRHPERLAEAKGADARRAAEIVDELFRLDGVGEMQLFPLLAKIQGNLLLVLDTCYSATLATRDAVEQKARNETVANSVGHEIGRFILAGARSLALDSSGDTEPHGLFTTHLLKGLDGEADLQHNGRINVAELLMFTKTRVREESRKLNLDQEPFYYFSGSNFFEIRAVAN
jgi:caspase domain-containing protein/WD40 domain-containing protein